MATQGKPLFKVSGKSMEDPSRVHLKPTQLQGEEGDRAPVPTPVDEVALQRALDQAAALNLNSISHFLGIKNQIHLLSPCRVLVFGLAGDRDVYIEANGVDPARGVREIVFADAPERFQNAPALPPDCHYRPVIFDDKGGCPDLHGITGQWDVIVVNGPGKVNRRFDTDEQRWITETEPQRIGAVKAAAKFWKPGFTWVFVADCDDRHLANECNVAFGRDPDGVLKAYRDLRAAMGVRTFVYAGPHRRGKVRYV